MYTVVLLHNGQLYWVIGPFMTRDGAETVAQSYRWGWLATVKEMRPASQPHDKTTPA